MYKQTYFTTSEKFSGYFLTYLSVLTTVLFVYFVKVPDAYSNELRFGHLEFDHVWARASIGDLPNSAAYVRIRNRGGNADRLLGASSELVKAVEPHAHIMEGGSMKMVHLEKGIVIPAGERIDFEPGGMHLMLIGLKQKIVKGQILPLTLMFEKQGKVELKVPVKGVRYHP